MAGNAARLWLLAGLAMALAACASDSNKPEPDPNILPTNFKKEIVDTFMVTLVDPTNVREAYVSDPILRPAGLNQRYSVCIRYNARGAARQYVGSKDQIAFFYDGKLNQLVDATKEQCGNAAYKPFPDLEKLCLGKTCE
jgi:ABC-type Fe3+-hydroxamate transport system substrate-binding protein